MSEIQIVRMRDYELSECIRRSGKATAERIPYLRTAFDFYSHTYTFFVALKGKRIIGCAMLAAADNRKPDHVCTRFIGVDPDYQGMGVGRMLNEAIFRHCADNGLSLVGSSYTEMGRERLKKMNHELSAQFGVRFYDPDDRPDRNWWELSPSCTGRKRDRSNRAL